MDKKKKNKEYLLKEIDKYFDCLLSDEEEGRLRDELSVTNFVHPKIDEAKAVMGFSTLRSHYPSSQSSLTTEWNSGKRKKPLLRVFQGVAAAVVLAVCGVGLSQMSGTDDSGYECMAFVNGRFITDDDEVMKILFDNIGEFNKDLAQAEENLDKDMEEFYPLAERLTSDFYLEEI